MVGRSAICLAIIEAEDNEESAVRYRALIAYEQQLNWSLRTGDNECLVYLCFTRAYEANHAPSGGGV